MIGPIDLSDLLKQVYDAGAKAAQDRSQGIGNGPDSDLYVRELMQEGVSVILKGTDNV